MGETKFPNGEVILTQKSLRVLVVKPILWGHWGWFHHIFFLTPLFFHELFGIIGHGLLL